MCNVLKLWNWLYTIVTKLTEIIKGGSSLVNADSHYNQENFFELMFLLSPFQFNGLMQERCNSIAMELRLFCTNPLNGSWLIIIWSNSKFWWFNEQWSNLGLATLSIHRKQATWNVHMINMDSGNGSSPVRCQAITWTNAYLLSKAPSGFNLSENWIKICSFLFKKIHLKMSSAKWLPFCPGLNAVVEVL